MSLVDLPRYEMCHVADLEELCQLVYEKVDLSEPIKLLAGGTDLMVELVRGERPADPLPLVVDISRMDELRAITWDGKRLSIGAAVTFLEMQRHPLVAEWAPIVARMARDVGGPTIQARGTLGGNLATASPAADGVAVLAALDANVLVRSARGARRIPFAKLQTGYKQSTRTAEEIIVAFELVPPAPEATWQWRKIGPRLAQAISKVALAGVAELDEGGQVTRLGLALASVAPVTARLEHTRALLAGAAPSTVEGAALDAAVESDISP
ncbi:MAG: FAD binding domain-containing protein, partial [Deltaproteobacteria bacterium]|nr:FAD binding domain-containing protein [Deltaproteobacteria bacterium]